MPNELAVAIVGAVGVVIVAAFGYLGVVLGRARANGHEPPGNGAAAKLSAAQADQIIQQVYSRLLDETQAERDTLKGEVAALAGDLSDARTRIAGLEDELRKERFNNVALLGRVREQDELIIQQNRMIEDLQQQVTALREARG